MTSQCQAEGVLEQCFLRTSHDTPHQGRSCTGQEDAGLSTAARRSTEGAVDACGVLLAAARQQGAGSGCSTAAVCAVVSNPAP